MKKVLIIGGGASGKLHAQKIIEQECNAKVYTVEEANAEGLTEADFDNIKPMELKNPYELLPEITDYSYLSEKVGKGGRARKRSKFNNK